MYGSKSGNSISMRSLEMSRIALLCHHMMAAICPSPKGPFKCDKGRVTAFCDDTTIFMMNYDSIYLAQDRKWLGNWRLVTMEVLCLQWSIISGRPRGQLAAYLVVNQGAMLRRVFYVFFFASLVISGDWRCPCIDAA